MIFAVALAAFQAASDRLLQTANDPYADLHDVVNTLKGAKNATFFAPFIFKNDHFTKTGSGQT